MSTHDMNIANAGGSTVRADVNSALLAIVSQFSSGTAPADTWAYMWWYDTATNILKMRNADDDAWISIFRYNQSTDTFNIELGLTSDRVLLSDANGGVEASTITGTVLGYLANVTSDVQAQINARGTGIALKDSSEVTQAMGTISSNTAIDLEDGNVVSCTIGASLTFSFSNPPASGSTGFLVLEITNGGAYTVTWPGSVDWSGGSAPNLQSSGTDILVFTTRDAGTTWRGARAWREA